MRSFLVCRFWTTANSTRTPNFVRCPIAAPNTAVDLSWVWDGMLSSRSRTVAVPVTVQLYIYQDLTEVLWDIEYHPTDITEASVGNGRNRHNRRLPSNFSLFQNVLIILLESSCCKQKLKGNTRSCRPCQSGG